jgi:hypothetical protein
VWGALPARGALMEHIQKAFELDIHVRRDRDERLPAVGIQVRARDIEEGVVSHTVL